MTASIFGTSVHGKKAIKAGGGGVTKTKMIKHLEKTIEAQACQKRKMAKAVKYYEQELENVKRFHQIMVEIMAEDIASLRMELNVIMMKFVKNEIFGSKRLMRSQLFDVELSNRRRREKARNLGKILVLGGANQTYYAVVMDPSARFKIRYEVPVNSTLPGPIMAIVYVDGQYDYTYVPIVRHEERIQIKDGFTHVAKNMKYQFKFDLMPRREDDKKHTTATNGFDDTEFHIPKIGGLGAVSVCFYRAEHHYQKVKPIEYDIKQPEIPEKMEDLNLEPRFATSFDETPIPITTPLESVLKKKSDRPLAVVHLHYRSKSWLMDRSIPKNLQESSLKHEVLSGSLLPPPLSSMSKNFTLPCPSKVLSSPIVNVLRETNTLDSANNISNVGQGDALERDNKKSKNCEKVQNTLEAKDKINDNENNNLGGANDSAENEGTSGDTKTLTKANLKKWWSRWKSSARSENIDPGQRKPRSEICEENEISSVSTLDGCDKKKKRKFTDSKEISVISSN
ncbi:6028_t:CDS:2 [Acaulospora colombiana]|uniref:6028_t:CDS:1 n=1 Tax=Acaulospora colombiana TaxID=27376 RepID=A0ACA9JZ35_9GLOM|nr:6028_t:CDS:2 [Acaulospora colombiana]